MTIAEIVTQSKAYLNPPLGDDMAHMGDAFPLPPDTVFGKDMNSGLLEWGCRVLDAMNAKIHKQAAEIERLKAQLRD